MLNPALVQVDAEDEWRLEAFSWHIQPTTPSYACRNERVDGKLVRIYLHREIAGAAAGLLVDHIDGNGLNCTRANLRICTHAENMRNRKVAKSNKLGVKGVWQRGSRFIAEIKFNGKRTLLGSFATVSEAAEAYASASKRLHGEFARH